MKLRDSKFRKTIPVIVISTEGKKTEAIYFDALKPKQRHVSIQIKVIPNRCDKSHPREVLNRLTQFAKKNPKRDNDHYWIVIDRDDWEANELDSVCNEASSKGFEIALSNPSFELWLYLHLNDNKPFNDRHHCLRELERIFDGYEKGCYNAESLLSNADDAIRRATALDTEPRRSWPKSQATRVYRILNQIIRKPE